ncbi:hypothetical protein MN116_005724 [Schistosoma mekongi]|uniref:Zinc transporter 2 n=1 Tax=Schistosoma mekongi TaxID=38744 RepID=A0AAE2D4R7_SCHME|nr:hypothetical protein MN116_005724 [Schistosoma mekongi]
MSKHTDNYHYGYEQDLDPVKTITNQLTIPPKHERLTSPIIQSSLNDHCHESLTSSSNVDTNSRRKLILASGLCLFFMTGEIIGGALAHSLAIMTDAAHLLTDFASFLISLLALFLASRPSTKRMSFGWHRAEVVGALASVLLIWLVTGILVYLAVMRIIHSNYEINGKIMLITSATGVAVNIIMLLTLHDHGHNHNSSAVHSHSHDNLKVDSDLNKIPETKVDALTSRNVEHSINSKINKEFNRPNITVRAAFIHVIGDLLQSIGVMIAAMVIYFQPKYKIIDPLCTFLFSILVLITTINILRDALNVLMEATPRGLNFNEVKNSLIDIPGVKEIHNLHMWSLTTNKTAVSVHLAIENDKNAQEILKQANLLLKQRYLAHDVTIQLELYVDEMAVCHQCKEPSK